jgi:hypothetical protein
MQTIWKYKLETIDEQILNIPEFSQFLCLQVQDEIPCLWFGVHPKNKMKPYKIFTFGTGQPMEENHGLYFGTYQLYLGKLVFHVFGRYE